MNGEQPDINEMLRNAQPSGLPDMRAQISHVLKKLTINGKGVTGGGLSFAIGNTGLGIEEGEPRARPQFPDALEPVSPAPIPPAARQPDIPLPPRTARSEINIPSHPPARSSSGDEQELSLPPSSPPSGSFGESGMGVEQVTGAVNGVPATILLGVYSGWSPLPE